MKNLSMYLFVGALLASGAVAAQGTTVRARSNPVVVTPAQGTQTVPATTTAPAVTPARVPQVVPAETANPLPNNKRLQPRDSVSETTPIPQVTPRHDRIDVTTPFPQVTPRHDRIDVKGRPFRIQPAPELAAVWQPLNHQVEVFGVDAKGALKGMWKYEDWFWEPAFYLSGPGLAPPGAPVAAVWQPLNEQLEVFTAMANGGVAVAWKVRNGRWLGTSVAAPANFTVAGGHLAAVFQPLNNQLEVFGIDPSGAVRVAYKYQNGRWQPPQIITPAGMAPPGAPITAIWQPLNEQLEVFWVGNDGGIHGVWKQHNGRWQPVFNLTPPGFTYAHGKIAAVWQPLNEQLELFAIDKAGGVNVIWKAHNGRWFAPYVMGGPHIARAGGDIVALFDAKSGRMQVVTQGNHGELIHAYKINNGSWKPGPGAFSATLTANGPAGSWPLGASLAGVIQELPKADPFLYFTVDDDQVVNSIINDGLGYNNQVTAISRANFGPIYGMHAAFCSNILRSWGRGNDMIKDETLQGCQDFTGVTKYCEDHDASVSVGYPPQGYFPRFLQCSAKSHSEDVVAQFKHIVRGVGQGLGEAFVATIVYSPEIAQAYACMDGMAFACASLAVDLAARAVPLPPEVKDAVDLANVASGCVNGDVISCAKLGAAGARAAGVAVPGSDAAEVASLTLACADDDYGACVRLGEKVAMAAGIPVDQISQFTRNAQDCYAGVAAACVALAGQATPPGLPLAEVQQITALSQACANKDYGACMQLAGKGAKAAGVPLDDFNRAAKNAQDCFAGDQNSCAALGQQAAAAGIPVGGLPNGAEILQKCGYHSVADCMQLGQAMAAVPR